MECFYLNMKGFHEQCIGKSPTALNGSTKSHQRCNTRQFLTYTFTSTSHRNAVTLHHNLVCGSPPCTSSVCQKWFLSIIYFLDDKGIFPPLCRVVLTLSFLLPFTLTHSTVRPSCTPCQIIPWSQLQSNYNFPFGSLKNGLVLGSLGRRSTIFIWEKTEMGLVTVDGNNKRGPNPPSVPFSLASMLDSSAVKLFLSHNCLISFKSSVDSNFMIPLSNVSYCASFFSIMSNLTLPRSSLT